MWDMQRTGFLDQDISNDGHLLAKYDDLNETFLKKRV